ncbi:MAG: 4-hydroxythreonine-4-phosphate dehydrogenase PdxA [Rhodobacteraceae bacterium]|nr:4-hydroxythreonine-4-phosphate dehydrogenase PdxA [Paracoccaceae bacterium]
MTGVIALTAGDPAGIGPEIAALAVRDGGVPFCVLGDPRHFANAARAAGVPLTEVAQPDAAADADGLAVLPIEFAAPAVPGQPDPANGAGIIKSIEAAVQYAMAGTVPAVCTLPVNKQVLIEGTGFAFPGHTEFLAHLGGVARSVMMLTSPELSVVPVTVHIPLADVPKALTGAAIIATLRVTSAALMHDFRIAHPRIAVAGLNPHAGEGGVMGTEEVRVIAPALDTLRAEGMDIIGPLPGDTMFHAAARETYDVAIAMYHDQGLIPLKTLNFAEGVNVTLGLPFIRTSPVHGTAYGLAGSGRAQATSLISSLRLAQRMARARATHGCHA